MMKIITLLVTVFLFSWITFVESLIPSCSLNAGEAAAALASLGAEVRDLAALSDEGFTVELSLEPLWDPLKQPIDVFRCGERYRVALRASSSAYVVAGFLLSFVNQRKSGNGYLLEAPSSSSDPFFSLPAVYHPLCGLGNSEQISNWLTSPPPPPPQQQQQQQRWQAFPIDTVEWVAPDNAGIQVTFGALVVLYRTGGGLGISGPPLVVRVSDLPVQARCGDVSAPSLQHFSPQQALLAESELLTLFNVVLPTLGADQNRIDALRARVRGVGVSPNHVVPLGGGTRHSPLAMLDLSQWQLTGSIPPEIGDLTSLRVLRLNDNPGLTGPLPQALFDLTSLHVLDLDSIAPQDEIGVPRPLPAAVNKLSELRVLDLDRAGLSAPLPWAALSSLALLVDLELAFNSGLTGTPVDEALGSLQRLLHLDLVWSGFTGPLPGSAFTKLQSLQSLTLAGNRLNGSLQDALGSLPVQFQCSIAFWDDPADLNCFYCVDNEQGVPASCTVTGAVRHETQVLSSTRQGCNTGPCSIQPSEQPTPFPTATLPPTPSSLPETVTSTTSFLPPLPPSSLPPPSPPLSSPAAETMFFMDDSIITGLANWLFFAIVMVAVVLGCFCVAVVFRLRRAFRRRRHHQSTKSHQPYYGPRAMATTFPSSSTATQHQPAPQQNHHRSRFAADPLGFSIPGVGNLDGRNFDNNNSNKPASVPSPPTTTTTTTNNAGRRSGHRSKRQSRKLGNSGGGGGGGRSRRLSVSTTTTPYGHLSPVVGKALDHNKKAPGGGGGRQQLSDSTRSGSSGRASWHGGGSSSGSHSSRSSHRQSLRNSLRNANYAKFTPIYDEVFSPLYK